VGAALIIALTLVVHIPAMRGGFVFDDPQQITNNTIIKAHDGLYRFWCTTEALDYYPLTSSLWWLEWHLWKDDATGYHVVNVLLHAANAVLVWMILRRLKIPGALLAALVFAVHPVNVATVAWISEQKNTLSMLFYTVAIFLCLTFDEDSRWRWYGLSLGAFLLALLSKSAVVMLPVVLLGCVWWVRGRVRWKDVRRCAPFFVLSLVLGLVTIWFQHHRAMEGHAARTGGLLLRLAAAGWVPWFYLYKAILPWNLTVVYPAWQIDVTRWVSYVPGMILISCFALFWWKRQTWGRPLLFGLGYFVVTLLPVLGFFEQGFYQYSQVADHWQYYAIIGVIALMAAAGERIGRRLGDRRQPLEVLVSAALLLLLGAAAWRRCSVHANDEIFWRDNVARNPNAWVAYYNLGVTLGEAGRLPEAMAQYERALQIRPDYAKAHNNLGLAFGKAGKTQAEVEQYEEALRIKPDFAEVHYNLGIVSEQMGSLTDAVEHYEQALRFKPDQAEAHYNLGVVLARLGRIQEATAHWEQALRIKPDYAEAHYNLGVALGRAGRYPEAIEHFEAALRYDPDSAETHNNFGNMLIDIPGRLTEGIAQIEAALRIQPDYAEAHWNLSIALSRTPERLPEAIAHLETALRLKPDLEGGQQLLEHLRALQRERLARNPAPLS
jgi:tetratricopeptide (TPR) repeat protein